MTSKFCLLFFVFAVAACSDSPPADTKALAAAKAGTSTSTCAAHPPARLDEAKVPPRFKDLIPLARQWGIGDDAVRSACIAESTAADRQALVAALGSRAADIHRWLDEVQPGQPLSNEQAAFLYMLNALETLDAMQSAPAK